jgi:DNA-binding MarR family transcriptional regulator
MIDDLEDRGLVERRPHPSDRRAKLVELTPAGREIAAQANAILDEPIAELSKLPKKDLEVIVRALEQLGDARQQPST